MSLSRVKDKDDPARFGPDADVKIMLFPEAWINLSAELIHHPKLTAQLEVDALFKDQVSFATNVSCIATYVNVAVDGDYGMEELEKLFRVITDRLRAKRGLISEMGRDIIIVS